MNFYAYERKVANTAPLTRAIGHNKVYPVYIGFDLMFVEVDDDDELLQP